MQRNDPGLSDLGVHSGGQSTGHAGTEVCPRFLLLPGSPPSDEGQYRWGVPPLEELYALVQVRQEVEDSVHAENFILLPICLLILDLYRDFFCPMLFFALCHFCPFTPSTYFCPVFNLPKHDCVSVKQH